MTPLTVPEARCWPSIKVQPSRFDRLALPISTTAAGWHAQLVGATDVNFGALALDFANRTRAGEARQFVVGVRHDWRVAPRQLVAPWENAILDGRSHQGNLRESIVDINVRCPRMQGGEISPTVSPVLR